MGKKKESSSVPATPKQVWKQAMTAWNAKRGEARKLAKEIVDLRNETTYSSTEKVDAAIGVYMRPSNLFIDISERLYGALALLESKQAEMTESVEQMSAVLFECEALVKEDKCKEYPDADMDLGFLQTLLGSITEQTLMEKNLCAYLRPPSDTSTVNLGIDHDAAVTILACFSYSPSLDEASFDLALDM